MKKLLTLALALILVISLLPMAAMAAEPDTFPNEGSSVPNPRPAGIFASYWIMNNINDTVADVVAAPDNTGIPVGFESLGNGSGKIVFKPSNLMKYDGKLYDLQGIEIFPEFYGQYGEFNLNSSDYESLDAYLEAIALYTAGIEDFSEKLTDVMDDRAANGKSTMTIAALPNRADYTDELAYCEAMTEWYETYSTLVLTFYGAHQHDVTCWIGDNNNHWVNCKVCGEQFLLMNWHFDYDEDDFCDTCGHEIIYYDITIKETDGVKITISGDRDMTAPYRDMIDVKVEAEDGYEVTDVRVWKIRENGTKDQIRRTTLEKGTHYEFKMQNFDCEIVPTVIKK